MEKRNLILVFVGLIFLFSLLPNFASAEDWETPLQKSSNTLAGKMWEPIKGFFAGTGDLTGGGEFIIKVFIWFLVFTIIFGVSEFIPGLADKNWLQFFFATIVSLLSVIYITPSELVVIMSTYTALAMTITTIIPLLILIGMSIKIMSSSDFSFMNVIVVKFLWVTYGLWLIYKVFTLRIAGDAAGGWPLLVFLASLLITALFVFFDSKIRGLLFKSEIKHVREKAFRDVEKADIVKKTKLKEFEKLKGK